MMNNKWLQILIFSLLFGAVGFLLGRSCSGSRCGYGGCANGEVHCARGEGGKADCGKSCGHKGCASGSGKCAHGDDGHGHHGMDDHAGMHTTIQAIENSDFEGDTTFMEGNATVTIQKQDGKMEVKVQKEEVVE